MKYSAVILAAGKGVRMCSSKPKVIHRAAGTAMVLHVVNAVRKAGVDKINLVIGHKQELVRETLAGQSLQFVVQEEQLGTGHALMQAENLLDPEDNVLVLAGDTPLLQASTLQALMEHHEKSSALATVLSTSMDDPYGYGRIIRDDEGEFLRIIEEKDASEKEKKIREVNSGIYCLQVKEAFRALKSTKTDNAQGEYYLTDIMEILLKEKKKVEVYLSEAREDIYGINDRVQLSRAEEILRRRKNEDLMRKGVSIVDPSSTFIDSEVEIGQDTVVYPFTIIEGTTKIGENCEIGPDVRISSSIIGNDVFIENSRVKEANVGKACTIGPYAYLRPGACLAEGVKIGDFVEIKKSTIGENSKVPHLSYVGDAIVGKRVNVGAGTITCNYDGKNKWETILEDGSFIGSNTNLVAPVRVGQNATTGAGSTITKNVPANALAVERAKQKNLENWAKRKS